MAQSINPQGWVVDDDKIILCPVVGFKLKPIDGNACALQFNYFMDQDAVQKNEVRAVQLVMPVDGLEKLLDTMQQVVVRMRAQPGVKLD